LIVKVIYDPEDFLGEEESSAVSIVKQTVTN